MSKGDEVARGKIRDNLKSCHLVTHSLAMTKKIQMIFEHFSNNDQFFFGNNNFFSIARSMVEIKPPSIGRLKISKQ
jgi:hypothetical protein